MLLAGCARYAPRPLAAPAVVLAAPDIAALSADAARIDRPFLRPQPIDLALPLTPSALAVIAVLENPELKAERAKLGVADAQAFAARLLPDPSGSIGFDKLLSGPDSFNAFAGQLAFDFNQLRLRAVTRAAGEASRQQVRLDLAWTEWQTAGQARLNGIRITALAAQLDVARAGAAVSRRLLEAVQRAAGRGDVAGTEVDARRQAALDLADKSRAIEQDLVTARGELDRLLGLPPGTTLRLAPVPKPAAIPAVGALVQRAIDHRFDLRALRAGYDAAEADVRKSILEQFPALSLTVAGGRDTSNNYTLGPQIAFTLPLWNRNRGNIAVAAATRAQLHAEYETRLFQARAEIAAAAAGIDTVRRQRAALIAAMPQLERFADAAARAARRGDLSAALADTAAQSLRDRQLTLLTLDQQAAEQFIALELLVGEPSEGWTG